MIGSNAFLNCTSLKKISIPSLPSNEKYDITQTFHRDKCVIEAAEFENHDVKVLVLGAKNCGKTSLLKQFSIIFLNAYSIDERIELIDIIRMNILNDIKFLVDEIQSSGYESIEDDFCDSMEIINKINQEKDNLTPEIADCITKIWKDSDIQSLYKNGNIFSISENAPYFFNKVSQIAQSDYMPTDDDILKVHLRTSGISKFYFKVNNKIKVEMVDVGGEKCEREKFRREFKGVDILLFIVSLTSFDMFLFEDDSIRKSQKNVELFKKTCESPVFNCKPIILIFTNIDIFEENLLKNPKELRDAFPSFKGNIKDVNELIDHIKSIFIAGLNNKENIICLTVNASDKTSVSQLFQKVAHKISSIK